MHFSGRSLFAASAAALFLLGANAVAGAAPSDVKAGIDRWYRGDYAGAIAQWRPLAEAGNADAQFNLGQAYKLGRGVPANAAIAQSWYQKAARQGHEQAQVNVGLLLYNAGRRQEALPWIRKGAELGDPRAQYILGTELFNGDLVGKDWPRAYALMLRAADGGVPPAADNLKAMERFIPADQRRQGVALARSLGGTKTNVFASAAVAAPAKAPAKAAAPAPRRVAPPPTPAPTAAAAGGRWRVQLGAFGTSGGAQRAWAGLKGKVGAFASLQPQYVAAGAVTRLQAGPLASRAAADRVCAAARAAGAACFPVAP
ncbi:MAG TPA: SPOR domain-containing protein [Allosphingosinicella sp.]|jgi:TPR repeat protein|nr:SPOR domain-containing protein [Allosphingosinicella sp.]